MSWRKRAKETAEKESGETYLHAIHREFQVLERLIAEQAIELAELRFKLSQKVSRTPASTWASA